MCEETPRLSRLVATEPAGSAQSSLSLRFNSVVHLQADLTCMHVHPFQPPPPTPPTPLTSQRGLSMPPRLVDRTPVSSSSLDRLKSGGTHRAGSLAAVSDQPTAQASGRAGCGQSELSGSQLRHSSCCLPTCHLDPPGTVHQQVGALQVPAPQQAGEP